MKIIHVVWFSIVLVSCNQIDSNQSVASDNTNASIPAGAIQQPFDDTPQLAALTLSDGGGNLSQSGITQRGKREGNWVEYHSNGMIKSITSYVNDKMEGVRVELSNNGQLEKKMTYHNDQLHGDYKEYRYSTVKEERFYQQGKLEGTVKIYYDNGKIMEEGAYKKGTRDGISRWYDQDGNVTIEYEYNEGQLIKK